MLQHYSLAASASHSLRSSRLRIEVGYAGSRSIYTTISPRRKPETATELWAWLFVHTLEFHEIPPDLPAGEHRDAVALANEATFTALELEADRKVMDEIQQAREYGEAQRAEGKAEGEAKGKAAAILAFLAARGIAVDPETRARITTCADRAALDLWIVRAATAGTAQDVVAP